MSLQNKNFILGDRVVIKDTESFVDGKTGEILGKSTEGVVDFYIILLDQPTNTHKAITMPEGCIEYVK